MRLIPLTHGLSAMVDDEDYDLVSKFHWQTIRGKTYKYFLVRVMVDRKSIRVGYFKDIEEAKKARDKAYKSNHHDFSCLT